MQVDDFFNLGQVTTQITVQFRCPPPVFDVNAQPLQVRRGQCRGPQSRSIGFARATDQDGGAVTYSIRPGASPSGQFTVNQQTGEISTTQDFTSATGQTLQVIATDNEGAIAETAIQVQVDCQNQLPAFDSQTYRWVLSRQECQNGGQFQTPLTATDQDGDQLQYEIRSGDNNNQFTIGADGRLTARPPASQNVQPGQISLQIVARDSALPTPGEGTTTVTVDNSACVNTPPVFDQPNQQIQLRQCDGQTSPIQVGRAAATDRDQDNLQYSITSPTDNSYTITQDGSVIRFHLTLYNKAKCST